NGGPRRLDPPYKRRLPDGRWASLTLDPPYAKTKREGMNMPNYRRNFVPGGTYFFTVVTHERRPLFEVEQNRALLRQAIQKIREDRPFTNVAMVLLPDHLH